MVTQAQGPIVESVRQLPGPALRPFIACYSGYRQAGLSPGRHRGLPSPNLTLIITLDEPLAVAAHPIRGSLPGRSRRSSAACTPHPP